MCSTWQSFFCWLFSSRACPALLLFVTALKNMARKEPFHSWPLLSSQCSLAIVSIETNAGMRRGLRCVPRAWTHIWQWPFLVGAVGMAGIGVLRARLVPLWLDGLSRRPGSATRNGAAPVAAACLRERRRGGNAFDAGCACCRPVGLGKPIRFCSVVCLQNSWVWVKIRVPKWNPGKWN